MEVFGNPAARGALFRPDNLQPQDNPPRREDKHLLQEEAQQVGAESHHHAEVVDVDQEFRPDAEVDGGQEFRLDVAGDMDTIVTPTGRTLGEITTVGEPSITLSMLARILPPGQGPLPQSSCPEAPTITPEECITHRPAPAT